MVKHIVMWKLKPENMEENAQAIKAALESLNGKIPGLRSLAVHRCSGGLRLLRRSSPASGSAEDRPARHH